MAEKRKPKTEAAKRKVQFEFSAPEAWEVSLAGDFNDWAVSSNPMKTDKKGTWKLNLSLNPGSYEYRLIVDGNWTNDPSCSNCVPNEFGSLNCLRVVE